MLAAIMVSYSKRLKKGFYHRSQYRMWRKGKKYDDGWGEGEGGGVGWSGVE